jgi:RarD protein
MNAASRVKNGPDGLDHPGSSRGFALGLLAYGLWGVLPIYFKLLEALPAFDIVAQRVLWSLPVLAALVTLSHGWRRLRAITGDAKTLATLSLTALLIGSNWLLYVYAVTSGHILAASFGYYLNPLANVLLGRFVLGEQLNRVQWTAVAIAAAGTLVLAAGALGQLWLSLALCVTFAAYGLLRKIVRADAVSGLVIETVPVRRFVACRADLDRRACIRPHACRDGAPRPFRNRLDAAAAAVHRRRPQARLFDARHAAVHRADAAVPDRGPTLRRAVHQRPRGRLCGDLGGAGALRHGAGPLAEAAAAAGVVLVRPACSTSSR